MHLNLLLLVNEEYYIGKLKKRENKLQTQFPMGKKKKKITTLCTLDFK